MTALQPLTPTVTRARARSAFSTGEPTIREMLDDPIVQLLMARDGVTRTEVEGLLGTLEIRRHL